MFVVLRVSRAAFSISFLAPSVCSNTVHEIKMDNATGRACSLPLLLAGSASPQFKYAPKEQYRNTGNRGIWNVKEEKFFLFAPCVWTPVLMTPYNTSLLTQTL